jgi:hypothetical protein|tara:strand:- start:1021 stop:1206 length:186 start_codon:yes stop_codon:yes gene_type:complete
MSAATSAAFAALAAVPAALAEAAAVISLFIGSRCSPASWDAMAAAAAAAAAEVCVLLCSIM